MVLTGIPEGRGGGVGSISFVNRGGFGGAKKYAFCRGGGGFFLE